MMHAQIAVGAKKELHLFDNDDNFKHWRQKINGLLPKWTGAEVISLDTTPSYIAAVSACERMSRVLARDTKFVLIVREPVERVWSEVLMKKRRVEHQQEFLYTVWPKYFYEIKECVNKCAGVREDLVVDDESPTPESTTIKPSTKFCDLQTFRMCLPIQPRSHGKILWLHRFFLKSFKDSRVMNCLTNVTQLEDCYKETFFTSKFEKMPDVPRVLYEEAQTLDNQMQDCCQKIEIRVQLRAGLAESRGEAAAVVKTADNDDDDLPLEKETCRGCGCSCFPRKKIISDISKHFLYRSLYFPQLLHCYASLPRERIMVIDNEKLKTQPEQILNEIQDFASLKRENLARFTTQEIHAKFREKYPDFESVTGWGKDVNEQGAEHDNVPAEVRDVLENFFRPYNRKLFDLLKIEPYKGWAV